VAAAGTIHRAHPQRVANEEIKGRFACWGRISPSCRNAISMEFQTRGLGSSASTNSGAEEMISASSSTSAVHEEQDLR